MTDPRRYRIVVCRGPECGDRRGSRDLHAAFSAALARRGAEAKADLAWQSCFGRCSQGPNVLVRLAPPREERFQLAVMPSGPGQNVGFYTGLRPEDTQRIVDEHVIGGRVVRDLVMRPPAQAAAGGGVGSGNGERR